MDSFRVYARVRPLNQSQLSVGSRKSINIIDDTSISLNDGNYKQHIFQLDGVYNQQATNKQIFKISIIPLINNVLNGINSTAFAYGITGAGKSFTMFGKSNNNNNMYCNQLSGIIPLTFQYLLNIMQQQPEIKIKLSYIQIYNEQVYDLFKSTQYNLQLTQDPIQNCVIVQDLTQIQLTSFQEVQQYINIGNSRRVIAQTKANQVSSRSHAIVIINVQRKSQQNGMYYSAKLSLVDLAGSEKQSVHYQTRGIRTFQGSNINRSLLTLGNCINMLSQKRKNGANTQQFIPYRDSKLTRLLKDSLGGNTKTVMIACISPSFLCYQETANTLKYACRANKIQKVVHANIKQTKSVQQYKKEISILKKENQLLKMNLNMSLMMPGLSAGFVQQQNKIKKNKVSQLLQKLTKSIQSRILGFQNEQQYEGRFQIMKEMMKVQQEIKLSILSQFDINSYKNKDSKSSNNLKIQHKFPQKSQKLEIQNLMSKKSPPPNLPRNSRQNTSINNKNQNYNKKMFESVQSQQNQTIPSKITRKISAMDTSKAKQQSSGYNQFKLALKQQFKNTSKQQQLFQQYQQNISQSKHKQNYTPLINLQNLRKKVMQDKKQFQYFKQQIKSKMLTKQQIRSKALKLLQMQQSSILRFNEQQKQYLLKLLNGQYENIQQNYVHNSVYSATKKNRQSLTNSSKKNNNNEFILNILQQNGVQNSRNRHLQSLNRIMMMKSKNNNNKYHNYSQNSYMNNMNNMNMNMNNKSMTNISMNKFNNSLRQQLYHNDNSNYNSVNQQYNYHSNNPKYNNYMNNNNNNNIDENDQIYIGQMGDTYRNCDDQKLNEQQQYYDNKVYLQIDLPQSFRMNQNQDNTYQNAQEYQGNDQYQKQYINDVMQGDYQEIF